MLNMTLGERLKLALDRRGREPPSLIHALIDDHPYAGPSRDELKAMNDRLETVEIRLAVICGKSEALCQ